MSADRSIAELAAAFPDWHIWRGRDGRGRPSGWFATARRGRRQVVPADGPAELRHRLRERDITEVPS